MACFTLYNKMSIKNRFVQCPIVFVCDQLWSDLRPDLWSDLRPGLWPVTWPVTCDLHFSPAVNGFTHAALSGSSKEDATQYRATPTYILFLACLPALQGFSTFENVNTQLQSNHWNQVKRTPQESAPVIHVSFPWPWEIWVRDYAETTSRR